MSSQPSLECLSVSDDERTALPTTLDCPAPPVRDSGRSCPCGSPPMTAERVSLGALSGDGRTTERSHPRLAVLWRALWPACWPREVALTVQSARVL
jgi:hypothetical protein